jgi:hypothetical protein
MPKAKAATRDQIARYGHIAVALRAAMKQRGWGIPEFNEAIGKDRGDAGVFKWLRGTGGISEQNRALISRTTGIPEHELVARVPGAPPPARAVALVEAFPAKISTARVGDVLSFTVSASGEARIRLDVSMPLATAAPLLRMLLDAGLVFNAEGE